MDSISPDLQIQFAKNLLELQGSSLQQALFEEVAKMSIPIIDRELAQFANQSALSILAGEGMRGELVFAVPSILLSAPRLLAYYRLMLGASQKSFYSMKGYARFKPMESSGIRPDERAVRDLCMVLCDSADRLVCGLNSVRLNADLLKDLSLLTLGSQLRGGANVRKGEEGIGQVLAAIKDIISPYAKLVGNRYIAVTNSAGRAVTVRMAADPDIVICEKLKTGERLIIAIEVKAGTDFSNVHNRTGEAEKSHQKARANGFTECWTILNVDRVDFDKARKESPSTDRFYLLSQIISRKGEGYSDFRERLLALIGLPQGVSKKRAKK